MLITSAFDESRDSFWGFHMLQSLFDLGDLKWVHFYQAIISQEQEALIPPQQK